MTSLPASLMNRLTAASAALTDRQRARFTSERVNDAEEDEENARGTTSAAATGGGGESLATASSSRHRSGSTESLVVAGEEAITSNSGSPPSLNLNNSAVNNSVSNAAGDGDDDDDDGSENDPRSADPEAAVVQGQSESGTNGGGGEPWAYSRTTMTLAELEEERELARRRMSACVLLTVFVLFKLWIDCIEEPSLPLLMVCLIGTSWTARWIRYNREREEELDRRIAQYLQANQTEAESGGGDGGGVMDRNDLRMLSFQAQLALAIMESQRHMMEGGRPDGENQNPGVSEAAKEQWGVVKFHDSAQYGSVKEVDAPHCSICLGEYEEGENLAQLPCQHLYHRDCIDSWTENHTKCPLCMADLEVVGQGGSNNV